jgi:hypothetical protein
MKSFKVHDSNGNIIYMKNIPSIAENRYGIVIDEHWITPTVEALASSNAPECILRDALLESGCHQDLAEALVGHPSILTNKIAWLNLDSVQTNYLAFPHENAKSYILEFGSGSFRANLNVSKYGEERYTMRMMTFWTNSIDECLYHQRCICDWLNQYFMEIVRRVI